MPRVTARVVEEIANNLVREHGTENPNKLADRLGLVVRFRRDNNRQFGGALVDTGKGTEIHVNAKSSRERRQFVIAHEILEHLVRLRGFTVTHEDEKLFDRGAAALLIPRPKFQRLVRAGADLFELKKAFPEASHEALARRLLHFRDDLVITVVDNGRVKWRMGPKQSDRSDLALTNAEYLALGRAYLGESKVTVARAGKAVEAYRIPPAGAAEVLRIVLITTEQ
ncbi:ImmA/IrrE family metallo-endopeptidase [bacterium]|nr:ImmA/IrrE family metallo-endopeptidase [bacterium]